MEQNSTSHWRQMFERDGKPSTGSSTRPVHTAPSTSYDDGYRAAAQDASLSPHEITDEAAMALAEATQEYRPWVLKRAARPAMLLHLRRYNSKSRQWIGSLESYPHLIAAEYIGDRMLSLDFGARHFVIEGTGLHELIAHLQMANVQMVQEYAPGVWGPNSPPVFVSAIRCLGSHQQQAG